MSRGMGGRRAQFDVTVIRKISAFHSQHKSSTFYHDPLKAQSAVHPRYQYHARISHDAIFHFKIKTQSMIIPCERQHALTHATPCAEHLIHPQILPCSSLLPWEVRGTFALILRPWSHLPQRCPRHSRRVHRRRRRHHHRHLPLQAQSSAIQSYRRDQ